MARTAAPDTPADRRPRRHPEPTIRAITAARPDPSTRPAGPHPLGRTADLHASAAPPGLRPPGHHAPGHHAPGHHPPGHHPPGPGRGVR